MGDRTRNLFDGQLIDGYYTDNTLSSITGAFGIYQSCKISLPAGTYTIVFTEAVRIVRYIEFEGTYLANPEGNKDVASYTFTLHGNNTVSLAFRNASNTMWDGTIKIQIVEGSESLPYEPYGYRVPVEINDYTVTLYLPEPLKMVGDEAEYVDYEEQRQYFADGSYANVTLPEIPTIAGTNTLSVDTQVQPSKVYVEVGIKTGGYTIYFYNGEMLLETVTGVPNGGTATYTGTTPTKSGYIFDGWNPSNTNITADTSCYAQFKEDEMYESITDTWPEIIANVSNGTYSTKYQVGDTKKIDLGTEGEIIMQVVGIDVDDLADNSGKAPITWISKQLLKTYHRMNPSYSSGTEGTGTLGGWEKTEMRSWLKNTVKPLIPETVRTAIKPVKKYTRIYNVSETSVNNVLTTDDVWIPSRQEVFGSFSDESSGVYYSSAFPDNASRIKSQVGTRANWWWLRSAYFKNYFGRVGVSGSYDGNLVNIAGGVALGFCT